MITGRKINLPTSGTLEINTNGIVDNFLLIGNVELTTDVTVNLSTPNVPIKKIKLTYVGVGTDISGNNLEILGTNMNEHSTATVTFDATYSEGSWIVQVISDFNTVTIPDESITPSKLSDSSKLYPIVVQLDSDAINNSAEKRIRIPHAFSLHSLSYSILDSMVTDGWTINIDVGSSQSHTLEFPSSIAIGSSAVVTALDNKITTENPDWLKITCPKNTAGGAVLLTLIIERL